MSINLEKIKLVVTDIDGTLLKSDGRMGEMTRQVFERVHFAGIHTAIATGRPIDALPATVRQMPCFEYVISCNGTSIYRMSDLSRVYACDMPPELVRAVADIFCRYDFPVEAVVDGRSYVPAEYYENPLRWNLPERMFRYVRETRHPRADIYEFIGQHVREIESLNMVIDDPQTKCEIRQCLSTLPGIYVTSSVPHYIECNHVNACKGNTMLELAAMLGVCAGEVMAFGDSENDLDMLEKAGIGVAVANASPQVRAAADLVTASNDAEGVAEVLRALPALGMSPATQTLSRHELYLRETREKS